jgi:hypothetical protein
MMVTYTTVASVTVFMVALFPLIARMSRRRTAAMAGAHHRALSDAEGLMRMDTDKG